MKRFYTFFAVLSIFVCVIAPAVGNEADWMPDANLRAAVRSALNLNNNDTLTQAGMANLTTLTARDAQISNLTGLEHATNLTSLDLRDNTISDISALSGLTNLESLKLKGNGISSVSDLSGLSNLTLLNLKENNISSISDLSGLTDLEHLRVDENSITDVQPLTSLVNLEKLWIAGNSLTNAHLLSSLTGLTQIDIPIPDPPDTTAPSVSISVPSDTQNGAFDATITFSEAVSDFLQEDLSLSGTASATLTNWSANTENTIYTATITPTTSGTVILDVTADVAIDVAGNNNTAADPQTVTITLPDSDPPDPPDNKDTTPPDVSVSVDSEWQNAPFKMTITFTEPVSGFEQSDLIFSTNNAGATITDFQTRDSKTYIVEITPAADLEPHSDDYEVRLTVPAGVATDAVNNPNTQGQSPTVIIDLVRPSVLLDTPSNVEAETFTADIWFFNGTGATVVERVSGFDQSDVSLTNNTAGATITEWSSRANEGIHTDALIFTAEVTATQSGSVTFGVAEDVATDKAGNQNTAADPQTVTITLPDSDPPDAPDVDTTPPGISFSADLETLFVRPLHYTANSEFDMTITFTEPVSGFELSDIEIWGWAEGSVTALTKVDDETYIATVNPVIPNGVSRMKLHIPPGVLTDVAGNPNARTYSPDITIEQLRPDVAITVPDADVETETFTITITFEGGGRDDRPLGFDQSDVSLTNNTAGATITKWTELQKGFSSNGVSFQGTYGVFEAEITVTQSGTITFGVSENVATDLAGNGNTVAVQKTVTITLPGSDPPEVPDVDTTPPGISFSADLETLYIRGLYYTANGPFDMTMTFTEPVSGFELSDIEIWGGSGGSVTALTKVDDETYTATVNPVIPNGVSRMKLHIPPGVLTDVAGNPNARTYSPDITIEQLRPDVAITVPDADVETETFTITITFDRGERDDRPLGFDQSDVSLTNNTAGATITKWTELQRGFISNGVSFQGAYGVFEAEITATQSGSVTFGVPENVATDLAGNGNTAAAQKTVTITLPGSDPPDVPDVDTTPPGISFSADLETLFVRPLHYTANSEFDMTITFTEPISGFEQSDIEISSGAGGSVTALTKVDDETYTATVNPVIPNGVRDIRLHIRPGVLTDIAGNPNARTSYSPDITIEQLRPNVGITVPDTAVKTETFTITISFDDTHGIRDDRPLGFEQSDVSLTNNTAGSTITKWTELQRGFSSNGVIFQGAYGVFEAEITATQSGSVTFGVPENVATDLAGNGNTAAAQKTVNVDVDAPGVSISVLSAEQDSAFDVTITFTETVSGLEQTDLVLSGTATATITAWNANTENTVYTATITPTTSGSVEINVAADVATDAAGNNNTAATTQTVTVSLNLPAWDVNTDGNVDAADVALVNAALDQSGNNIVNSRTDVNGDDTVDDADVLLVLENFPSPPWDVNEDGSVDIADVLLVALALGQSGDGIVNSRTDINMNGTVENTDLLLVTGHLDANNAAPMSGGLFTLPDRETLETLDIVTLEVQLAILRRQSDGSPKYLLAITLLESFLEAMRPDETQLLANYPNPFNPETWIPYHLAKSSDVRITIYDVRGSVVRRLELGHLPPGYYTSRSRAAYWDGRNDFGERVATGIYFYHLRADNMSLLRKMVILK